MKRGRKPTLIINADAMFADYQAGLTQNEISVKYGLSQAYVSMTLSKHPLWAMRRVRGNKSQVRDAERAARRESRKEERKRRLDDMFADYQSGMSYAKIAEKYGLSRTHTMMLLGSHPEWKSRRVFYPVVDGKKECSECHVAKPLTDFTRKPSCSGGVDARCRECTRAANKAWREANPEKQKYRDSWQHRNPEWRKKNLSEKYRRLKQQVIQAYGGKCCRCGFSDRRALHVDHVNEDGAADRKKRTPLQRLQQIVRDGFPANYQLLCANCNTIKAVEAGTLRYTPTCGEIASVYKTGECP